MSKSGVKKHQRFWQTANDFVENAVTNNIVLAQAMGICPIIAAGITLKNGVALTVCTAAILLPIGLIMSLTGDRIPKWLRPALYTVLASLILVGTAYVMETFVSPELYAKLYLFIPLMAVNTLHTYRSVGTATTHPVAAVIDALGVTVGFGLVICIISALREMVITDSLWGHPLGYTFSLPEAVAPFAAFILLGFLSALLQWTKRGISNYFHKKEGAEE